MQAKQIRGRHFKSSVGTLLNENYGSTLPPKASARNVQGSDGTGNSTPTPASYKPTPPCGGTTPYKTQSESDCVTIDGNCTPGESDGKCSRNDSVRAELYAGQLSSRNSTPCGGSSVRSNGSDFADVRTASTSKSQLLHLLSKADSIRSGSCRERPMSSISDTVNERSTTTGLQDNTAKPCTPFGDTSRNINNNRDRNDFHFDYRDEFFRTDVIPPPRYYDAYAEAMGLKSRRSSRGVRSAGSRSGHSSHDIEWPLVNRPATASPTSPGRDSRRSNHGADSMLRSVRGVYGDVVNRDKTAVGLESADLRRESSAASRSSSESPTPFRVQRPRRGDQGQVRPFTRHSSHGRKTSAATSSDINSSSGHHRMRVVSENRYSGQTPSHTPTPDYTLPYHASKQWTKHYSPTRVRHFLRATAEAIRKHSQHM